MTRRARKAVAARPPRPNVFDRWIAVRERLLAVPENRVTDEELDTLVELLALLRDGGDCSVTYSATKEGSEDVRHVVGFHQIAPVVIARLVGALREEYDRQRDAASEARFHDRA